MKKTLLLLSVISLIGSISFAQTVIFDNGQLVNLPGGGSGGADVSHLHDGMNSLGSNHASGASYRVADDITVPIGETWNIDSLVFYCYQTGSGLASTITDVNVRIWDGDPGDISSNVIFGDETTNRLLTTDWSGAYRTGDFGSTNCDPATCTTRPIMRNATIIGATLTPGTYWIDWQSNGSLTSGPWAPAINLGVGVTTTGNALQYVPASLIWQPVVDTVPAVASSEPQGFPFLVVGSVSTGVHSINSNNNISIAPNPIAEKATVTINLPVTKNDVYTFIMFDILGNEVNRIRNINTNKFDLYRGSLNNGIYFYEMKKGNTTLKKGKLIFQ